MVEVLLDGQRCDLSEGYRLPDDIFRLDMTAAADLSKQRSGQTLHIELPSTPRNDALMLMAKDACAGELFNAAEHTAQVWVDGVMLMQGVALLEAVRAQGKELTYCLKVRSGGSDWVEGAALTKLGAALEYEATLDGDTIKASWGADQPVRFLPVLYDDYTVPYSDDTLYPPQRVMTVADYYPFLSLRHLVEAAAQRAGYELAGDWVKSTEFSRLMMSGRYPQVGEASIARLKSFAGFEAGRTTESTEVADSSGRVCVTSQVLLSSLGNMVQTTEGEGLYCSNGCLTISEAEGVVYRPPTTLTVGFEYYFKYKTDYSMLSRKRLKCFDSIYLGNGCDMRFQVANPFKDSRSALLPQMEYKCKIFDHEEGATYRLRYIYGSRRVVIGDFNVGCYTFVMPALSYTPRAELLKVADDGTMLPYAGEWAIYEGFVQEQGEVEVEITLQSPPEQVTPSGKVFNQLYIHGAEPGQSITLSRECRLRPVFTTSPALGSKLTFEDVAAHDIWLIELIEALQQMYNLRIYTDEAARKVYIMPRDEFYRGDEHDWSHKVDLGAPVQVEDMAMEQKERFTLAYRAETDGAVSRFNAQADSPLGEWTTQIESRATLRGEERKGNTLFTPTLSTQPYATAPSAWVMQVGDRDADQLGVVSARVVSYEGLLSLPSGQLWGYPSFEGRYPLAVFHLSNLRSLCFEDRGNVKGLHRFYDKELQQRSRRRRVRLTMHLTPLELRSLAEWESSGANLRSTFVLNLSGQRAAYNLEAVESYDAATQSAVCRFIRTLND